MNAAVLPQSQIRAMRPADLQAEAEVELASYQYPWNIGIFRDCLLAGYQSLVLDIRGNVSGYCIMSIAAGEAHLLNICIHPSCQRLGYGRRLLVDGLARAREVGVETIFLEVRPSNDVAIMLTDRWGSGSSVGDRRTIRPMAVARMQSSLRPRIPALTKLVLRSPSSCQSI